MFSLPVKFQKGNWEVAQDINISEDVHKTLKSIAEELIKEKEVIFPPPRVSPPPGVEEVSDESEKKVFGTDETGEAGKENGEINEQSGEGVTKEDGPLSKIPEESEVDSKEGEKTTDTEKSGEEA